MAYVKCYKEGTEHACAKDVMETRHVRRPKVANRRFGIYPPDFCVFGYDNSASPIEVGERLNKLKALGFDLIGIEAGRYSTPENRQALDSAGFELSDIQIHTSCKELERLREILNSLVPPDTRFDSIYVDEPLARVQPCDMDYEAIKRFSELIRNPDGYGQTLYFGGFYQDFKFFEGEQGELFTQQLGRLAEISDGLGYTRYTNDYRMSEFYGDLGIVIAGGVSGFMVGGLVLGITGVLASATGVALYRTCRINPKACLQIDDWARMRYQFPDKVLTAWINIACHPDHYTMFNAPCNKDYFDDLLCNAMEIGMDRVMLFADYDIRSELYMQLLNPDDYQMEPELQIRKDEIRKCIDSLDSRTFKADTRDERDSGANRLVHGCASFREAMCEVFWRRAEQYSGAALRCGWIEDVYEETGKVLNTLYCISSGGAIADGMEEIDCKECKEWNERPVTTLRCRERGEFSGGGEPTDVTSDVLHTDGWFSML